MISPDWWGNPEQRESETGIVGDVVAPRDPALLEDGLQESLLGEGNGGRCDRPRQMLGLVVRRDRLEAGSVRVDQVGGRGPGAGESASSLQTRRRASGRSRVPPTTLAIARSAAVSPSRDSRAPWAAVRPFDHRLEGLRPDLRPPGARPEEPAVSRRPRQWRSQWSGEPR